MSTSKQIMSVRHKEEYLQLIVTQKTAITTRCQQQGTEFLLNNCHAEDLFRCPNQPTCQPKMYQAKDATLMNDDDFLLAELNGHFQ